MSDYKKIKKLPLDLMEGCELEDYKVIGNYEYLEIRNSKIISCDFQNSRFDGLDIDDTIIERSNLSNLSLVDHSYNRVIFKDCNLTGINFTDSYLKEVEFINCNLRYSNFSEAHITKVKFKDCELSQSSFMEITWKDLEFNDCNMNEVDLYRTKLDRLDLSSCSINNMKFSIEQLRGLIVSMEQAIIISAMLGIKIK